MRTLHQNLLAAVLVLTSLSSAWGAGPGPKITYDDQVLPILRDKCFACHNQDRKSGGLRLHTYAGIMAGGASGEVVKPGDPDQSRLFQLVSHQQEPYMPPKSAALPKESLDTLRAWIQAGAPENNGSKVQVVNKPKVDFSLAGVVRGKPEGPPPMPSSLPQEPVVATARADAITALAASPWAPLVAVGGQKQVTLYQADTFDLLGVLPFPEGVPQVLKFSRNGSLLLAGGGEGGKLGRVVVWNVKTGERLFTVGQEYDSVLAADISADQSQIALGGPSKMVRVYSTRDGQLLYEIKKHTDWVTSLEFSPDGVLLASGDRNGGLFVWEAPTGREFYTLRGHTAAITGLSWRPDANVVASASEDGTVRLWEMENGNQIKSWGAHGGGVEGVAYSPDGRLVSCGRDKTVKVWDGNGNPQRSLEPFGDIALRAVFTQDNARVVAGDWSGEVRVWSVADGKVLGRLLANPPTLAQRLEAAHKEQAALTAERDRLAGIAAASRQAADKAAAELTAAQAAAAKAAAEAQAANQRVTALTPAAKAAADKAAADKAAAEKAAAEAKAAEAAKAAAAKAAAKPEGATAAASADKNQPTISGGRVAMIYGTTTGHTQEIADMIKAELGDAI
ncbi:MAG: hypothetical protein JO112_04905, partial [Planctomycetes bacterium]|nr:hypothetical protein [Planctomycetota bacterium]